MNIDRLAYQLYSSRNFGPLPDTLAMLAEAGYSATEGFGGLYQDPDATAAALREAGLSMPSGHFGIDQLEGDLDGCLAIARTLGIETIYCPHLAESERPPDAGGWAAVGARLAAIEKGVRSAGLAFGWHNHDFEVRPLPDGSLPLDHLLEASPTMEWEADLAWIIRGGGDALACIRKHRARLSSVHIKDIAVAGECADEDGWADVGHGTAGWEQLLAELADCPVRHWVVEHDLPNDDARFAQRSAAFLRTLT